MATAEHSGANAAQMKSKTHYFGSFLNTVHVNLATTRKRKERILRMAHFDERSGIIPCKTEWGKWWQTIDEVYIEINSDTNLNAKEIKCTIRPNHISLHVRGMPVIEGDLYEPVHADEAVWTLEDKRVVLICLSKAHNTAAHCWPSLLHGKYQADPLTLDEMQKKLTLQRFQLENPGMDFSGAAMTGNYQKGGPDLPS